MSKRNGQFRMIFNLKELNNYIPYHHFKMEGLHNAVTMMLENCYMAGIDLADAYYCVPVQFCGQFYKYTVFPNGLVCCLRTFTKLLKPVFSTLCKQSNESVCYIDDAYLNGPSYEQCQANIRNTVHLFEDLGFIIHTEKSVLTPVQICFLGFILNFKNMTVRLTREKVINIQTQFSKLIRQKLML